MRPWAIHWDTQLYKALEVQFQWGLESISSQIPTINTQLIFKDQKLQFRPPLEELKSKYYLELKKFMSIPQKFRGIQNVDKDNNFFGQIVVENADRFEPIYEQSKVLFEKVQKTSEQFESWIVLGQVNVEDVIEENFKVAKDWEDQLKNLKAKAREAERLPVEIRIDCVLVSTQNVKSAIDDLIHRNDCEQFGLEIPEFSILDEMEKDLQEYENNYLLYEKFNTELEKLGSEEWILFRSKTYLFDEFLQYWQDHLKSVPATPVTVRLQKDMEQMREFSACLKYCRGEMLSGDHWLELFRLLKLPKGTTLEKLTFTDLIGVQTAVIENVEQLKNLNSRAQGEVTIREAIQELEVWAAQAEFNLTEYKHSNGTTIKIIKEWKEAMNQVKDNQALLQS
uniref:Dynein heavy chain linker domain-containing protein n=1 Tax=Panagrolaimus sp. JU765 TaxID=591449 RepID=A0AC34Q440_9BILA